MRVSFEIYVIFFSICYYYYYRNYFIASRRWFLTYIYSNFENTFFGLSNLELFIESLCASNIYLYVYVYIYIYFFLLLFLLLLLLLLLSLLVFSTCTGLVEKRIRFPQGLSLVLYSYFRTFHFCIVELWVLVNLKYRKK